MTAKEEKLSVVAQSLTNTIPYLEGLVNTIERALECEASGDPRVHGFTAIAKVHLAKVKNDIARAEALLKSSTTSK